MAIPPVPAQRPPEGDATSMVLATTQPRQSRLNESITVHGMYADQLNIAYVYSYARPPELDDGPTTEARGTRQYNYASLTFWQ